MIEKHGNATLSDSRPPACVPHPSHSDGWDPDDRRSEFVKRVSHAHDCAAVLTVCKSTILS